MATEAQTELLRTLYYDPEFGLQGATKFTQKVLAKYKDIPKSAIQDFLKKQSLVQVNAPRKSVFKGFYKISSPPRSFQMDIFFLPAYKSTNDGISSFMIFVDILSRKMWIYPIKNKTTPQLLNTIKQFHGDVKDIFKLESDNEFNNKAIVDYCIKNNIVLSTTVAADEHFTKGSKFEGNMLAIVDAAVRTIKGLIRNYILSRNSTRFIDKLDSLVKNYNSTNHSAFKGKLSPNQVFDDVKLQEKMHRELQEYNQSLHESIDLDVGDYVRVAVGKKVFDKANITFSTDIYVISDIVGNKYEIIDENGDELKRLYRYFELQKVADLDKTIETVSDKAMNEERGLHLKTVKLRQQLPSKTYSEARNAIVSESSKKKVIQRKVVRSTDRVTRSGKIS